jgi:anti-sigma regulatory factor (Ser/Thr protein kinase)
MTLVVRALGSWSMSRCRFQMSATFSELVRARGMVESFCDTHKLPAATSNLMNLALDEILSNIVKYAYEVPETGTIEVELEYSNNKLTASIEDRGVAFDPFERETVIPTGPLESREEGGLGIVFVKTLLDSVAYERIDGRNRVTLTTEVRAVGPSGE